MNGNDILESINELDPELLTVEAKGPASRPRPKLRRIIVIAAAALLLFGGVTAHAAATGGLFTAKRITTVNEDGYTISTVLNKVKWSRFKGAVAEEAPERIAYQIKHRKQPDPLSSVFIDPTVYAESFSTAEEALEYLGLDSLKVPALDIPGAVSYLVAVHGSRSAQVETIRITVDDVNAERDHINAQATIEIVTEHYAGSEYETGGTWLKEYNWRAEFSEYVTAKGNTCDLATLTGISGGDRTGLTGYISIGDALYKLHLTFYNDQADRAYAMLESWIDSLS